MSGEWTWKGRATAALSSPWLVATLAALACSALTVGSLWLFLSNLDQLVPAELARHDAMAAWGREGGKPGFAGHFWQQPDFWRSLHLTVVTSTITSLVAALVGIPAAYALSRRLLPGRALVDVLFASIIILPSSSVGLCLIVLFQYGPLHRLQEALGIQVPHSILPGIVVAQLVLSLAIGMSAWRAAFDGVNPRFEQVSRSLGSSCWTAFRRVVLPLARPGLLAGVILAWVRAMAEFGAVLLFCGTFRELPLTRFTGLTRALGLHQADILPVAMWSEIEFGNLEYGFALGFVLVAITAVFVYLLHRLGGKGFVW
jgi:ABC-type sulfate transport system permease component